jgi:hypothetical protein
MISLLPLLLRNWMLIALVAAIGAVPAAYKAGKWRQANLDAAAWKIENARLTSEAYAAADRVSREVIEKQQQAADQARAEAVQARTELVAAEDEARASDEKATRAEADLAAKAAELAAKSADATPPAQGQVRPACPPPVVRSCNDFAPDELDELRRKYPHGPIRRAPARHPQ